jgi:hypothetical protein
VCRPAPRVSGPAHADPPRDAIYSQQFREFISDVSGVKDLCERPDMAANVYTTGCHLMCHDDVITTRRVTYVLYFTDPDNPWTAADGGAFEVYGCKDGQVGIPDTFPLKVPAIPVPANAAAVTGPCRRFCPRSTKWSSSR